MDYFYFSEVIGLGEIFFTIDSNGILKELWLGNQVQIQKNKKITNLVDTIPANSKVLHTKANLLSELHDYENGQNESFNLPFDAEGTAFQKEVWKMLLKIPFGTTCTYGDLAEQIAKKRGLVKFSAQAVGQAVGKNPLSLIIPCHRVIGKNGDLIGYSGGIVIKRRLLEIESQKVNDKIRSS